MKDGKPTISILTQITQNDHIEYQLQIALPTQTYFYYSRFSELHSLFSQLPMLSSPFPRKHRLTSFVAPYIGKETEKVFLKQRLEDLKRFFSEISKRERLQQEKPFQEIVKRAKNWEQKRLEQKPVKGKSLNEALFGCGVKTSYVLA